MRIVFLLAVLAAGLFYTHYAFATLQFFSISGRLGPGFFPRILGTGIVALTLLSLGVELRQRMAGGGLAIRLADFPRGAAFIIAMTLAYLVALRWLGASPATALFLLGCLAALNPGRWTQNLAIALLTPVAIHLLFREFLNAATPQALLPLPF